MMRNPNYSKGFVVDKAWKTMRYHILRCAFASALLSGCAPGYSLKTISETSSAIVIEYTHSVGGELQAAIRSAEAQCQQYGRHARMNGQPTRINMDRSVATFDCVTP
jgi:hypothetical protein